MGGGARLILHNPYIRPQISTDSIVLSPGTMTYIDIRKSETQRAGKKYNISISNGLEILKLSEEFKSQWVFYTDTECESLCLQNFMAL